MPLAFQPGNQSPWLTVLVVDVRLSNPHQPLADPLRALMKIAPYQSDKTALQFLIGMVKYQPFQQTRMSPCNTLGW
jgi:hypothetical protein